MLEESGKYLGVEFPDDASRLGSQLSDQCSVLDRLFLVEGRTDGDAFGIHNDDTLDTLVGLQTLNGFFDFRLLIRTSGLSVIRG